MALAAREAAKSLLAGLPGRRSVVLIHDDADNRQADARAAAAEASRRRRHRARGA